MVNRFIALSGRLQRGSAVECKPDVAAAFKVELVSGC